MASGANMNFFGAYTGTGSANTISVGFQPRYVRVTNTDDGAQVEVDAYLAHHATAAKRGGRKTAADGAVTFLAVSAGITITATGFTVGTDDAANESGKQFTYTAVD